MYTYSQLKAEIEGKIEQTYDILNDSNYKPVQCSPKEFYDYMTGEIFSEDKTTIHDILNNQYLMIHELVEISELKKVGITIHSRVIVESPKETIYTAHLQAMDYELGYIKKTGDTDSFKKRLYDHYKVLTTDPYLPDSMKPRAEKIWNKYRK